MSLHSYEKLAFELLSKVFFYLWPLPVKWNDNYSEIVMNTKPKVKLAPFAISIFCLLLLGIGCVSISILHVYVIIRQDFGELNAATLLIVASTFFMLIGFICKTASESKSIISGCNGVFKLFLKFQTGA